MNLEVKENQQLEGEYLEQTQEERNKGILKGWLPYWVRNAFENFGTIVEESKSMNMCVSTIRAKDRGPAVILGSGPSLDEVAPLLGDWKGAIFCSGSNAMIPTRWGHQPEYICIFDGGDTMYPKLIGYDWSGSMLLCNPSISPLILKNWKWDKRYYLMRHQGVQWFDEILPLAFGDFMRFTWQAPPCIMIGVGNAGCTANNEIQLANYLGYGPLFLLGVDFGYPGEKERCTRWVKENGEWHDIGPEVYSDRKLHKSDNGILTTEEQIEYKSALFAVYKWDKPQLFDCSNGIITELPKLNFKEVVEKNGKGFEGIYRSDEEIVRVSDEYFNSRQRLQDERTPDRESESPVVEAKRIIAENSGECKK
jgi:hypothetical protein